MEVIRIRPTGDIVGERTGHIRALGGSAGATNNQYQPLILTSTIWYHREVLSGNDDACVDTSDPVEILNVPVVTGNEITSADQTVCTDDLPQLMQATTPGGGRPSQVYYLWESRTETTPVGGGRQYQREQFARFYASRNDRRYHRIQKGGDVRADRKVFVRIPAKTKPSMCCLPLITIPSQPP